MFDFFESIVVPLDCFGSQDKSHLAMNATKYFRKMIMDFTIEIAN